MSEELGKKAFLDEARELLTEIEESLLELEDSPGNSEQIARLFRAMHTLKGSGAMFGFDEIARFTHEVETVYDTVRAGKISIDAQLLGLTLEAKDHIQNLLDVSDTAPFVEKSNELMARFRQYSPEQAPPREPAPGHTPFEVAPLAGAKAQTFWIRFRPSPDSFLSGTNPLGLLEELATLGRLWPHYHDQDIPLLQDISAEKAYGYWDVLLVTDKGEDAVRDVFIFVEDDGGLAVRKIVDMPVRNADTHEMLALADQKKHLPVDQIAATLTDYLVARTVLRGTGVSVPATVQPPHIIDKFTQTIQSDSIRVDSTRLDSLVNLVGELVIVQSRLTQASHNNNQMAIRGIAEELQRLTAEMRDHALGIRMVPIGSLYSTLRRLVRDLATSLGKPIEFIGHGAETELDKNVIDRLKDPLVHMLRNCADHGIESPEERLAAGKPPKGTIVLSAAHESGNVVITIKDDGHGIDPERIRQKALDLGLVSPDAELTPHQIYDLLFLPGLSTARSVTSVSGRGVGMDVVRKNIDALRGSITIDSELGKGTTVIVRLPLTLAIIDGLLFRIGRDHFIIPLPMVQACQERQGVWPQEEVDVIERRGDLIPCLSLRRMLGIAGKPPTFERIIIAGVEGSLVGLVVDAVVGQQQAVIKSLSSLYRDVRWVSGTTINGDGGISLILDVPQLVRFAQEHADAKNNRVHSLKGVH